jgi:hypothetical protein
VKYFFFAMTIVVMFSVDEPVWAFPPALFVYPVGHRFADGRVLNSPQTLDVKDITTNGPDAPELAGVVLMVYWSTICPTEAHCDFSLIDETLDYWRSRGKKAVIAVATNGFPIRVGSNGSADIQGATPEWVMQRIKTYPFTTRLLGALPGEPEVTVQFPDFRDKKYLDLVSKLVHELGARYDGNPTVAQMRISTGVMGEDNPMVGPVGHPMSGYNERQWLDHCRNVVRLYYEAFTKSELQFDIGRVSYLWTGGTAADKAAVDKFIDDMFSHRVMLAFDGLSSASAGMLEKGADLHNSAARSITSVEQYHDRGGRTKLEMLGLLSAPRNQDVSGIVDAVRRINPEELVFFVDMAQAAAKMPSHSPLEELARRHADEILRELGYH